jgi:UDP-N-acetylmuramyl pentapeptide phosphotransferase/UDP-N-acetylglucosamine-1-phosphate transferase
LPYLPIIIAAFVIAFVNYSFTKWFIKYARVKRITDIPSERSSHVRPTPRGGGVGFVGLFFIGFSSYLLFFGERLGIEFLIFLIALLIISTLGWFDDRNNLSRRSRFGVQLIASLLVLIFIQNLSHIAIPSVGLISLGIFGFVIGVIWITGVTNIYNFMDGVDGLSSVQAISASAGWCVISYMFQLQDLFVLNLFVIAGVIGFLFLNWLPARIFMGDVGSLFLGFLFAVMPFMAAAFSDQIDTGEAVWFGALLLWPFLFDGAFTIIRRSLKGENIFEAHRSHLYQRLNIVGWSHQRISLLYSAFSIFSLIIGLYYMSGNELERAIVISLLIILSFFFSLYVSKKEVFNDL